MIKNYPHNVSSAFDSVYLATNQSWPEFLIKDEETVIVKNRIERWGAKSTGIMNYETHSLEFNKAFFFKNLLKNMASIWLLQTTKLLPVLPVIDIGSGAGTASIAAKMLIGDRSLEMRLIDQSSAQLAIASKLAKILRLSGLHFDRADIGVANVSASHIGILSYWLCEQERASAQLTLKSMVNHLNGGIVLIDYPTNIEWVGSTLSRISSIYEWRLELELWDNAKNLIGEDSVNINGCYCKR